MGPTPIANHHTEERSVAMLGTHPRRQASTCQACLLAVPLSLLPNSLYYVRSCRTVHSKISPLFAVELELLLCSNHYFISNYSKGCLLPSPLSYAMCSFFVFGFGATTKDTMHQWGPCAHEEEVWET